MRVSVVAESTGAPSTLVRMSPSTSPAASAGPPRNASRMMTPGASASSGPAAIPTPSSVGGAARPNLVGDRQCLVDGDCETLAAGGESVIHRRRHSDADDLSGTVHQRATG